VETAEKASPDNLDRKAREGRRGAPPLPHEGKPIPVEPDLDFIRTISRQSGDTLKKCFQCGTCSATCELSPDRAPFPRKEMAWAVWGMKDRLLNDPDVWLCHHCNDCSVRCPRGAAPGDVLAAVRQEGVVHYAVPRFLAKWANEPQSVPLMLGIPTALLALALVLKDPIENILGMSRPTGDRIVFSYSHMFPHWLLNSFFMFFSLLAFSAVVVGVRRFWQAMEAGAARDGAVEPAKSLFASIAAVIVSIFSHEKFALCTKARSRFFSHFAVFFGFLALSLVAIWVVTARYNPLIQGDFVYPFGFWNPWKMLANLGGIALLGGLLWMAFERLRDGERLSVATFSTWALLGTLLIVVLTGFVSEVLHYLRLEPHRHIAYFVHLVFVFTLLIYLPYSKFAHIVYRTVAMVHAEYSGRDGQGLARK
jgi:quinone-modifying oxidoreductase, subunit QmoC